MIKITKLLFIMLFSVLVLGSCMKTEETETSPQCAILTFSVGDIKSPYVVHRSSGIDTTLTKTVSGSTIYFNIDQVNGIITTVDSVANWVDLSKICPSFTSYGTVYGRVSGDSLYYQWTSGSDSISFENPADIIVLSTDGTSTKHYTVSINRSTYALDTINWSVVNNDFSVTNDFKTIELGDYVYAFFKNDEGKVQFTKAYEGRGLSTWSTPQNIRDAEINYSSIIIYQGEFYALGTDGYIYMINRNWNAFTAEKVSSEVFKSLVASDDYYIYAFDGKQILCTQDFNTWNSCGNEDIDMLPTSCYNSFSYQSKTNPNIRICMMNGLSINNTKNSVAWYKVTSKDEEINQNWMYIQVTGDNSYGLPKFNNMSSTMLGSSLYAIGIDEENTYRYLYKSDDNGITWHVKDIYPLPEDLSATNGTTNLIAADGKLWIIQKGGNIWSGVIR